MFEIKRRLDLQLFAEGAPGDGGAGGEGANPAATGENAADAGRKWLLENGAPAAKITSGRAEAVGKRILRDKAQAKADGNAGAQVATAAKTENDNTEKSSGAAAWALPEGTTWEQIMSVPEMNARMQDTVKKAKRSGGAAQKNLEALTPALEVLARHHGLDIQDADFHTKLAEAIEGDDTYYEARALQMGVDVTTARRMDQQERKNARQIASQQEQIMQQHYVSLVEQGKAMMAKYPGFDLRAELKNDAFRRLTHPSLIQAMGGLEGVYEHVHRKELQQQREAAAAELARQQAAQTIQAGGYRPGELGAGQMTAVASDAPMTPERARKIAQDARRGIKVAL